MSCTNSSSQIYWKQISQNICYKFRRQSASRNVIESANMITRLVAETESEVCHFIIVLMTMMIYISFVSLQNDRFYWQSTVGLCQQTLQAEYEFNVDINDINCRNILLELASIMLGYCMLLTFYLLRNYQLYFRHQKLYTQFLVYIYIYICIIFLFFFFFFLISQARWTVN